MSGAQPANHGQPGPAVNLTPPSGRQPITQQVPAVGQIVHYVSRGSADGAFPSVCRAAIVTEAHDDFVGLAVLNPTGLFFDADITFSVAPAPGTWHWPERFGEPTAASSSGS